MQFQTGLGLCIAFSAEESRRRLQLRSECHEILLVDRLIDT
jgi:hypothetical protein